MNGAIRYIGIARKAGAVDIGETNTGAAVRSGKARLVILASDASGNAARRAENFVYGTAVPLITVPYTKEELSHITGVGGCSMAAFKDVGLASAFVAELSKTGDEFKELSVRLARQDEKARMLRRERLVHQRSKSGKSGASGKRRKMK